MRYALIFLPLLLLSACAGSEVRVERVIDGDTLIIDSVLGARDRVRIIGIDTPEIFATSKTRKPECYAAEARERMRTLIEGKEVKLETKPQEDKDAYGRLLRYVRLGEGDIGAVLLREGFAEEYGRFPHPRREEYRKIQREAKDAKRGLWSACKRGR